MEVQQPRFLTSFVRSQITSIVATGADFFFLIFLTEFCHLWYLFSVTVGAIIGGSVSFLLGRCWAFTCRTARLKRQIARYFIIWIANIILTISVVFLLVNYIQVPYVWAKVIVASALGILFTFPMQRYFVYVFEGENND